MTRKRSLLVFPDTVLIETTNRLECIKARVVIVARQVVELRESLFDGNPGALGCRTEFLDRRHTFLREDLFQLVGQIHIVCVYTILSGFAILFLEHTLYDASRAVCQTVASKPTH